MITTTINTFDVFLIGRITESSVHNKRDFHALAELIRSMGDVSIAIPGDLFDEIDTHDWKEKDYLRLASAVLAQARCVVTLNGWEQDQNARTLVRIAREIGIPVIPAETVKHAIANGNDWLPNDDRA